MSIKNVEEGELMKLYVRSGGTGRATSFVPPERKMTGTWYPLTGDIVMFERTDRKFISRVIGHATQSEWTHCGLVCAGLPTSVPSGNLAAATAESEEGTNGLYWQTVTGERLFLFEAATLVPPMWDFMTGRRRTGVRVVDAYQRIHDIAVGEQRRVIVRRVRPHTPRLHDAIVTVQKRLFNGRYDWNPVMMSAPIYGPGRDDPEKATALEQHKKVFCSQLIADVLMEAEILPNGRAARTYAPQDFEPGGSAECEMAQTGFSMSPPVVLCF